MPNVCFQYTYDNASDLQVVSGICNWCWLNQNYNNLGSLFYSHIGALKKIWASVGIFIEVAFVMVVILVEE